MYASKLSPQQKLAPRWRKALLNVGLILLAPLVAILLTLYVFQSYQVDGVSMQNTLHANDKLLVWKLPRTWAQITGHQYVPKRGDIVIVNIKGLGGPNDTKQLVKRVIGLPGDRVVVAHHIITIYNAAHPTGFVPDQTLPYGAHGAIPATTNDQTVVVGSDELFICGDNRSNSLDSRMFGSVHTSQIVGKLAMRLLPFSDIERF